MPFADLLAGSHCLQCDYAHHQGLISSALRVCFAILFRESDTYGNTRACPETSAMQLAWTFPRNSLGIETLPRTMPDRCLGTAVKDILIMMFYIVHKDSAKCVAAHFFLLASQDGMDETKICSTSLFFSSFATAESWRFIFLARMRQDYILLSSALIIKTLCILLPALSEKTKK